MSKLKETYGEELIDEILSNIQNVENKPNIYCKD